MPELMKVVSGNGPRNLVMIHGWAFHPKVWQPVAAALDGEFQCHLVYLPGHGGMATIDPYSTDNLVSHLAGAVPEQIDGLVGWSMGGMVSMCHVLRHKLSCPLVLVATMPNLKTAGNSFFKAAAGCTLDGISSLVSDVLGPPSGVQENVHSRMGIVEKAQLFFGMPLGDPVSLWQAVQWMQEEDLTDRLNLIRQPTMIVHGTRDEVIPVEAGVRLHEGIAHSRLELFEDAGHTLFLDDTVRFVGLLREFFGGS